jgi:hypothetical protein
MLLTWKHISKFIFVVLVCLLTLYVGRALFQFFKSPTRQDFEVYYVAARDVAQLRNPYQNSSNNYVYPPSSFFILLPLSIFPHQFAVQFWLVSSLFLLAGSIYFILKLLEEQPHFFHLFLIMLFALAAFPTKFTLGMGQMNIVILFLIVLALFFAQKQKALHAGIALGLAASIKIFPFFFLLWFLYKKEYKAALFSIGTFILLNALPILFLGFSIIKDYYAGEFFTLAGWKNAEYYNQALSGFLLRLSIPSFILPILTFIILLGLLFFLVRQVSTKMQSAEKTLLEWSTLLCIWLITQPVAWQHYFVLLTLPFIVLGKKYYEEKNFKFLGIVTLLYFAVALNIKGTPNGGVLNPFLYSHLFLATFGVYLLLILRLHHLRKHLT